MKIIIFLLILLLSSCAVSKKTEDIFSVNDSDWNLIEKIEQEKWDMKKLTNLLGEPSRKYQDPFFIVYDYSQMNNHQKWGFRIGENNRIVTIIFKPNASNGEEFSLEKVSRKWGKSCVKKKDVDTSMHFIRNIYYIDCDKFHRAYLNRYDEVTSLEITIE